MTSPNPATVPTTMPEMAPPPRLEPFAAIGTGGVAEEDGEADDEIDVEGGFDGSEEAVELANVGVAIADIPEVVYRASRFHVDAGRCHTRS